MSDTIAAQVAIKFGGFHIRKPRAGKACTATNLPPAPRICVRLRISEPMQKASTPPAALQSAALCKINRRKDHSAGPL